MLTNLALVIRGPECNTHTHEQKKSWCSLIKVSVEHYVNYDVYKFEYTRNPSHSVLILTILSYLVSGN